jgi:hypothetical protein
MNNAERAAGLRENSNDDANFNEFDETLGT